MRRFAVEARFFRVEVRHFDVAGPHFDVAGRRFDVDARQFDVEARRKDVEAERREIKLARSRVVPRRRKPAFEPVCALKRAEEDERLERQRTVMTAPIERKACHFVKNNLQLYRKLALELQSILEKQFPYFGSSGWLSSVFGVGIAPAAFGVGAGVGVGVGNGGRMFSQCSTFTPGAPRSARSSTQRVRHFS